MSASKRKCKINNVVIRLINYIPNIFKSVFRLLLESDLLKRLLLRLLFWDKYTAELVFQIEWAREFKSNKDKVLEYWRRFRYLDDIIRICKIKSDTKILDVGCGISTVLHFVEGKRYGIDPLACEYKRFYTYPEGINIQNGFGEEIPFPNEYFDVVFCSNVLDHVSDPAKTIEEIKRVLKSKGYFVLTVEIFEKNKERSSTSTLSYQK
jgi:ubiquinone/menaquinone biosynthesis C-methylase UbiE